ncbi:DUF4956 domain-containing protein [bacterium]|nr:DUF4956 domain-containing protein [bacterium]
MLNSIFSETASSVELSSILLCSIISIILGVVIALTHKQTSKYNKNFLVTLSILPLLVQTIIIMVNGNLGTSVAIMGAFSLVRFRSLPGTSKEILSVFFAMTVGLATGMGHLVFAIIITIIGSLAIFILSKVALFNKNKKEKILKIMIPENLDYTNVFDDIFETYTEKVELEQVKTTNMGSMFDLSYRIILNENVNEKEFLDDLRVKNGNLKVMISHPIEESDL